jgi:hypothetical protein
MRIPSPFPAQGDARSGKAQIHPSSSNPEPKDQQPILPITPGPEGCQATQLHCLSSFSGQLWGTIRTPHPTPSQKQ